MLGAEPGGDFHQMLFKLAWKTPTRTPTCLLLACVGLALAVSPSSASAMSKSRTTLTAERTHRMRTPRPRRDATHADFDLGEAAKPTGRYRFVLPVHFISYNQYFRLPHKEFFKSNARDHLDNLRTTFDSCGIDIELKRAIRVVGPNF